MDEHRYAVIGAGPSGLSAARALQKAGIAFDGYEASRGVGGLWDIENPALDDVRVGAPHLVAHDDRVRRVPDGLGCRLPEPPHAHPVLPRLRRPLRPHRALPLRHAGHGGRAGRRRLRGCCAPRAPTAPSSSATPASSSRTAPSPSRTCRPSAASSPASSSTRAPTRAPRQLTGKRVLIIGAGNSGCDIAVDAVHHAASVDMSVRRGYYFVPRYLFGRPSDTLNQGKPLPARIKQFVDTRVLKAFTGDPVRFGFPKPDYKLYESHPIVNTLILNHLGQGDLRDPRRRRPLRREHGALPRRIERRVRHGAARDRLHARLPVRRPRRAQLDGLVARRCSSTSSRRRSTGCT